MDELNGWPPAVIAAYLAAGAAVASALLNAFFAFQLKRRELELKAVQIRREIMFRGFQERRADAVAQLYSGLVEFLDYAHFMHIHKPPEDQQKEYDKRFRDVANHFRKNRILFAPEMGKQIWDFIAFVSGSVIEVGAFSWETVDHPNTRREMSQERLRIVSEFRTKSEPLLRSLEDEFRQLLNEDFYTPKQ